MVGKEVNVYPVEGVGQLKQRIEAVSQPHPVRETIKLTGNYHAADLRLLV